MKKNYNSKTIKTIKTVLRCFVMMLMVSCGQDSVKDQINLIDETETELEGTDEVEEPKDTDSEIKGGELFDDIYQKILEYDFSVQEYPIDTTRYAGVVEQEFLKAFYDVLTNWVPLQYWDNQNPCFFKDSLLGRGKNFLSDRGFTESFVKKASYRLIDMDGDGLPELEIETGGWSCILKYDMERRQVTEYFELMLLSEGWKLLGSNRLGVHDTRYPHLERNKYLILDEQGETVQSFYFDIDFSNGTQFMVSAEGEINGQAVVTEEEWEALTEAFFDAMENPITYMTYEEVFGEIADWMGEPVDEEDVRRVYREFLAGERSAENVTISGMTNLKGEMRETEHLIYDVTGDQVPELVIRTKGEYYILTYRNDRLFVLLILPADDYVLLESGEILYRSIWENWDEYYEFDQIQPSGNILIGECFRRKDLNRDGIYDETDEYQCDTSGGAMQAITMEEWLEKTAEYLYVDGNGAMQIIGSLEWPAY